MTPPPGSAQRSDQYADLRAAIDRVTHGSASPQDLLFIERTLADDPDARAFYLDYTLIHTALQWEQGTLKTLADPQTIADRGTPNADVSETIPTRVGQLPHSPFRIPTLLIAATLLAACGLAIYLFTLNPEPSPPEPSAQPLATLIESTPGSHLTTPGGFISEGRDYPRGEYALDKGTAEFMLTNSVNVKLRGRTRLVMHHDMAVSLDRGSAHFVCPADAKGFTVHLPDRSKIIDLGTAFSVRIDEYGSTRLSVSSGEVRWHGADATAKPLLVTAGRSARIVDGLPVVDAISRDAADFVWTGAGDAVSFFRESNWGRADDPTVAIPVKAIDPGVPIAGNLAIDSSRTDRVGGGDIVLGDRFLIVHGDAVLTFDPRNSNGIIAHPDGGVELLLQDAARVTANHLDGVDAQLVDASTLTLRDAHDPLGESTVDLFGNVTTLRLPTMSSSEVASQVLDKITVRGAPAELDINVAVRPDSSGGSTITPIFVEESTTKRPDADPITPISPDPENESADRSRVNPDAERPRLGDNHSHNGDPQ